MSFASMGKIKNKNKNKKKALITALIINAFFLEAIVINLI